MFTLDEKEKFASLYIKLGDYYKAAAILYPKDYGKQIKAATQIPSDKDFIDFYTKKILDTDNVDDLPGKSDLAKEVWRRLIDEGTENADAVKLAECYGKIIGVIANGSTVNNTINAQSNKVLLLRHHGTDADWANKLLNQQNALIEDAMNDARNIDIE